MSERLMDSQRKMLDVQYSELTAPQLFLSSDEAGWEDLLLRAYHEPTELEGWIDPVVPELVLVLLTRGTMLMEQQARNGSGRAFPIHQGDFLLKPAGTTTPELSWRSLSSEPMQTLHLHLNNDLLVRTSAEMGECDPADVSIVARPPFQDPLLLQVGLALRDALEQPAPAGKLYAQTAAQMLAVHLLRYYTSPTLPIKEHTQGLTPRQVERVAEFVLAHLDQDLSLSVLASQVGFSPYHFARLFRRATGESPHQFVLHLRIEHAKHLLRDVEVPLAHVALASGFANQSHLTQTFKRYLGLAPAVYRKEHAFSAQF